MKLQNKKMASTRKPKPKQPKPKPQKERQSTKKKFGMSFGKRVKKSELSLKKTSEIPFFQRIYFQLISSFMVIIICIIMLGVSSYMKSSSAITSTYENSAGQTMKMMVDYLDLAFNNVQSNYMPYMNEQELKYYFAGLYLTDSIKQTTTFNSFKSLFGKTVTSDPLVSNYYFLSDKVDSITTSQTLEKNLYTLYSETESGTIAKADKYKFFWFGTQPEIDEALNTSSDKYGVRLVRQLPESSTFMIVDVKRDVITNTLSSLDAGEGSVVALVTQDGKEVLSNDSFSTDGSLVFSTQDFYATALAGEDVNGFEDVTLNDTDYLFLYHKLQNQNAMLCSLIPKSYILAQVADIRNNTILFVIIGCLLAIILGTVLSNGISSTINNITHQLRKVAKGDLTVEVRTKRKDEFKLLTAGITDMIANMKLLIKNVNDMSNELTAAATFVAESSSTFMQTSQDIQFAISDIESGINQLDVDSADCLSQMDSLSTKISTVSENTTQISKLTTATNASIHSGISSMDVLNESAQATSQITSKVITAIEQLEERSRSISHIVDAINDIAEETNLLSLNASIEAARAGEAGRGFSVVAEQIRKLADQSLNSANEINKIIEQMIAQTHDVVQTAKQAETIVDSQKEAVSNTTTSFNDMSQQISNLVNSLTTITSDVDSMGVSRDTTLSAIESISAVSEETSACSSNVAETAVKQLTSVTKLDEASSNLAKRAEELTELLKQFTL
ncbi:MAG: methyl-accepting chemotaxis protein [Lachnospiraceae bacterium]|nr:methyl-accepting chemotaxis protein [Lachnospiraceae bacterium]